MLTIRAGTQVDEMGRDPVICDFDDDPEIYVNPGPWRIPHHHTSVLHYCRLLGVPLEVFVNDEQAGRVHPLDAQGGLAGQTMTVRQLRADMRGYVGELLAKSVDQGALDDEISEEDGEALIEFLVGQAGLDADELSYSGVGARGYDEPPGAGNRSGELTEVPAFSDLVQYASALSGVDILGLPGHNYQMTMFQPVGGMDRIAQAFGVELSDLITYGAEVSEIRRGEGDEGVRIVYEADGDEQEVTADYAIVTIPLSVLHRISNDFSSEVTDAMRSVSYAATGKAGLQMSRRFWETDHGIYGGHSWSPPLHISYPSGGMFGPKGVLMAYYNFGTDAIRVSNGSQPERMEYALEGGSAIHDEYRDHFETGIAHSWHLEYYNRGGWAQWTGDAREDAYQTLLEPDGPFYFAGEHLSYLTGWMAGAVESAWDAIESLHERAQQEAGN